jgi:hypothetical protein
MTEISPSSVATVSLTYYPKWYRGPLRSIKHTDKIRGDLAIEFAKKAVSLGFHVVLVDGQSTNTFKKTISSIKGVKLIKRRAKKRSPNRRLGISFASKIPGVRAIILTEAEKVSLLDSVDKIVDPILSNAADVVIPKREERLFRSSYPDYQYVSEVEGNHIHNEALRAYGLLQAGEEDLDLFFGPRVFKNDKKVLSLFMKRYHISTKNISFPKEFFDAEEYSNAQFFPVVLALKQKMKIQSVEIPFSYPKTQKQNEEKGEIELFIEKRKAQRLGLIVELLHFLSYLDKNPGSRVRLLNKK